MVPATFGTEDGLFVLWLHAGKAMPVSAIRLREVRL
jgi:hypothetical protein